MLGERKLIAVALALVTASAGFSAIIGAAPNNGNEPAPELWGLQFHLHDFVYEPDGVAQISGETPASFEMLICVDEDGDDKYWPEDGEDWQHTYSDQGMNGYSAIDDSFINFAYYSMNFAAGQPGGYGMNFRVWVNGSHLNTPFGDGWCAYVGSTPLPDGTYSVADSTFTFPPSGPELVLDIQLPPALGPSIISVIPPDGSTGEDVNSADYVIMFSEPMNKTGTIDTNLPLISPWAWSSDGIWLNASYDILEHNRTYFVDLTIGNFKDTVGLPLTGDMNKTFDTNYTTVEHIWKNPFGLEAWVYQPDGMTKLINETQASFEIMLCVDADDDGKYWPEDGEDWHHTYSDEGMNGYYSIEDDYIHFAFISRTMQPGEPGDYNVYYKIWVNGSKFIKMDSVDGYCAKLGSKTMNDGTYRPMDQLFQFPSSGGAVTIDFQVPGFILANEIELNLTYGWNLISFPSVQPIMNGTPMNKASDLFNVTSCLEVAKWNTSSQTYDIYIPGFNLPTDPENFDIGEDDAVFVWWNESSNGTFVVGGYQPGHQIVILKSGWNMIVYKGLEVQDVTLWADQVSCGIYDDICYFNGQTFVHYILPGTEMQLVPTRGYFIWSDIDTTLIY